MLVLSRKIEESIMIGEGIEVKIVDVNGRTVKLGIEAPRDVAVHRKEVFEAIKKENLEAAKKENVFSLLEFYNKRNQ